MDAVKQNKANAEEAANPVIENTQNSIKKSKDNLTSQYQEDLDKANEAMDSDEELKTIREQNSALREKINQHIQHFG